MPPDSPDSLPRQTMRVLGLRVTVDQDEFLNRVARKRGVPKSVYLRLLIEKHMENGAAPYNPITA